MKSFWELYDEADDRGDDINILLGNGFSMAADQSFNYSRLLDRAEFSNSRQEARIRGLFNELETADFEVAVQRLDAVDEIIHLYDANDTISRKIECDSKTIREVLAKTLTSVHPKRIGDIGDDRIDKCHDLLVQFDQVFTLNYDLLLYWAINRKHGGHFQDGFRRREDVLVYTHPHTQTVSWLHGALHLYEELAPGNRPTTLKHVWDGGVALVDQLHDQIVTRNTLPLIVMEGTWQQKQTKINSSPYLSDCLTLLRDLHGTLFTFGWSMSDNDLHIRTAIQNSQVGNLYVGLHGGRNKGRNPDIIGQATALKELSENIELEFWDTASVSVW